MRVSWKRDLAETERTTSAPRFHTLHKGGTVLDSATGRNDPFDVGITDGRIAEINLDLKPEDAQEVIGVAGKLVIPGMIDTHAHSD